METLHRIQENLDVRQINPDQLEDRIIFGSMSNDTDWTKKREFCRIFRLRKRSRITEEVVSVDHPIFRGISALNRGVRKRKGGICTIHLTVESSNTEL